MTLGALNVVAIDVESFSRGSLTSSSIPTFLVIAAKGEPRRMLRSRGR